MTISLQSTQSDIDRKVKDAAERLLSVPVIYVRRIGGGLNGRVFQIKAEDGLQYAMKFYHSHDSDKRSRLTVEFSGLSLLWENGIRAVPRPIAINEDEGCALYSFIEGKRISSYEVTARDIADAVSFLAELKSLKTIGRNFGPASEAYFSLKDIDHNLEFRIDRLKAVEKTGEEYDALYDFLNGDLLPFRKTLMGWAGTKLSLADKIKDEGKILSPSDFGFHNALRDETGRIVFLDFEHFGWDDPAKTIADFLLHPAMELKRERKQQFVTETLDLFRENTWLKDRLKVLYPVFGIKWCLIFLNEFIPAEFDRRDFALTKTVSRRTVLQTQLLKATKMLNKIKRMYRNFPYET